MTWQPVDIQIEQELLGGILLHNQVFAPVSAILDGEHFFEPIHRQIWEVIKSLIDAGRLASPITIRPFLPALELAPGVSVAEYVARLAAEATVSSRVLDYAKVIRELADKRTIGEVGRVMAPAPENSAQEVAAWVADQMDTIVSSSQSPGARGVSLSESMERAVDAAAMAYQNDGKMLGLSYGLSDLDQKTLGAQPGNLIVIAARTSMGKTALAVCITRNMGIAGKRGLFVSLEMADTELSQRMIADQMFDEGRFFYSMIRSGKFHESVFSRIKDAAEYLRSLPIRIEQEPSLSLSQIAARARRLKRQSGLDFMIVDHLSLVRPSGRYSGNKVYEIGEVTTGLKSLAKELEVPIFLLSQVSRSVESREDKRPTLSDLRMSGDIEQDADTVIFLYRPAYYLAQKEPTAGTSDFDVWAHEMSTIEHRLDAIIAKQRSGPLGTVRLFCDIGCNAIRTWHGDFS